MSLVAGRRRVRLAAAAAALSLSLSACTIPAVSPPATTTPPPPAGVTAPADVRLGISEPVADPIYPQYGNPALDVLHYNLELSWAPDTATLSGTATVAIRVVRPVTELVLDFAHGYAVASTTVDGTAVTASRRGDDLVVPATLAAEARTTLIVVYSGKPAPVPMPSGRSDYGEGVGLRVTGTGEAWTMQEPFGAFTWYPANDQPSDEALYDITVTVPKGWSAVANGALLSATASANGEVFHWRSVDPVASYLATLAVGRYTRIDAVGPHGLPLTYWLRTGRDDAYRTVVGKTPQLLTWLEERFGPYPFPTAGVVMVDSESAMETQQMVTYGAHVRDSGGQPDLVEVEEVLLHEYSHQWFGDSVTPRIWQDVWLNEGWAMYAEWLWSVDKGLASDDDWERHARTVDASSRVVAGPPGHPDPGHFGEGNIYFGPALMLHAIHHEIGDTAFFAMARDWVQTQRNKPVDRAGFIAFVNQHTGHDFTALINTWLDSPTTPAS